MEPTYKLAFDVMRDGPVLHWAMLIPFVLTAVGLVAFFTRNDGWKAFYAFFFLLSGTGATLMTLSQVSEYLKFRDAYEEKSFDVVEGCLEAFHPIPQSGHDSEVLFVGGHRFEYSDFVLSQAFSRTESHGGPVHRDSRVRAWHIDGAIIRLEVADKACPPARIVPSDYKTALAGPTA